MKKRRLYLGSVLLSGMLLTTQGCSMIEKFTYESEPFSAIQNEILKEKDKIFEETRIPDKKEKEESREQIESTEVEEELALEDMDEIYYGYWKLNDERKRLYLEMYNILSNRDEDKKISTVNKQIIDPVFTCLMNDHPELFFVEGYKYTEYSLAGEIKSISFSGTYNMTMDEVENNQEIIEQKVAECINNAPKTDDEYLIAKYLYEYLIDNTEYDSNAENNQNICSVFISNRSVCQGYAKALQYLLNRFNIQSFLVTGFTNSERHAWNLTKVNGAYYYIDPTWGDASYSYNENEENHIEGFCPAINYDYFMVTTDELMTTHSIEKIVELPECTSISDNYFVREGLYFTEFNEQQLIEVFDKDEVRQADYVTIKCCDNYTFGYIRSKLIDEQKVFDYISNRGETISYADNSAQRTISFWNIFS